MKELIGMYLICMSIVITVETIIGYAKFLAIGEICIEILLVGLVLALLFTGAYLIV